MDLIILSIIAGIIGAAFLSWGIYQIKTGKMVAKNRVFAVDEPREVGVIFVYLGMLGLVWGWSGAGLNTWSKILVIFWVGFELVFFTLP